MLRLPQGRKVSLIHQEERAIPQTAACGGKSAREANRVRRKKNGRRRRRCCQSAMIKTRRRFIRGRRGLTGREETDGTEGDYPLGELHPSQFVFTSIIQTSSSLSCRSLRSQFKDTTTLLFFFMINNKKMFLFVASQEISQTFTIYSKLFMSYFIVKQLNSVTFLPPASET